MAPLEEGARAVISVGAGCGSIGSCRGCAPAGGALSVAPSGRADMRSVFELSVLCSIANAGSEEPPCIGEGSCGDTPLPFCSTWSV